MSDAISCFSTATLGDPMPVATGLGLQGIGIQAESLIATPSPARSADMSPVGWIVHDVGNDAPCTGCVASPDDPNWGGPHLRHSERSNVSFVDGHVQPMKASQWYWGGTPWLKPALGGE